VEGIYQKETVLHGKRGVPEGSLVDAGSTEKLGKNTFGGGKEKNNRIEEGGGEKTKELKKPKRVVRRRDAIHHSGP